MDEKDFQMRNCQLKGIRSSSMIVAEPFLNKQIRLIIDTHCNQRDHLSQKEIKNLIIPNKEFNEYIQL